MLKSKPNRIAGLTGAIAAALLCSAGLAHAIDGPSFDCSHGVNSALAKILCSGPVPAKADWDLSSVFWAGSADDTGQSAFNQFVRQRCGLPAQASDLQPFYGFPMPAQQPITETHVRCVIGEFNNRTTLLRARLKGDALVESRLTPEEHIDIQQALLGRGLLRSRNQKFGVNPDGQFGPNTRAAIQDYQRSIDARPTGFLSDQQRLALQESPEEIEARATQVAEEGKLKQAGLDAMKQAAVQARRDEERAKQDAIELERKRLEQVAAKAAEEGKLKQAALDSLKQTAEQAGRDEERARQNAIDQEGKRLEQEAAKAADWREKVQEAQKKGPEYAARVSDVKWALHEQVNPMTDEIDYTASSKQTNGSGAVASVDAFCKKDRVFFQATLENGVDPKLSLGFITSGNERGIVGKKRINDGAVLPTDFTADKWRNRVTVSTLDFTHDAAEAAETTWRVLAEIETSYGTLYIKIPMYEVGVRKLISNCQHLSEREKQREGRPDASASKP